jgi:O-antigen/teichoic acid export membrane protein
MALNSIWTLGRNAMSLILAAAIIHFGGGIVAFAASEIPIAVILLAVTLAWMRQFGRLTPRVPLETIREVVVGGLPFWANEVFFTVYLYIDAVILAALAGAAAVGIYAPATQMFSVAMFLTGIIGPATLPQLSRLGVNRGEEFRQAARKVLSLFIIAGVPITIGLTTFAQPLIVTIFGPAYRSSAPVLVILSLAIVPMFLNFQFSQTLAASDRQWRWAAALAGACLLNPVLNVMFVPLAQHDWHNAALGAALAWLVTELAEVVYGTALLAPIVLSKDLARTAAQVGIAGGIQLAAVWFLGSIWLPLGEMVGAVLFSVGVVVLGAIPREDLRLLAQVVSRRVNRHEGSTSTIGLEQS